MIFVRGNWVSDRLTNRKLESQDTNLIFKFPSLSKPYSTTVFEVQRDDNLTDYSRTQALSDQVY